MPRSLRNICLAVLLVYGLYAGLLFLLQDRMLYPGTVLPVPASLPKTPDARLIRLSFPTGESVAFYLPPKQASNGSRGAMIVAHGNGEIADYLVDALQAWRDSGLALLLVEYPGYGRAPGRPSDESIRDTMVAAFDWLVQQPEIDGKRIAAHGISLGGGAVGLLLRERPLAAAILHSTFTSLRAFPPEYGLPGFLLRHEMNTLEAVRATTVPVLVVHGKDDTVIAPWHGAALAAAANMTDFELRPCGHGCFHDEGRPLYQRMQAFLRKHRIVE